MGKNPFETAESVQDVFFKEVDEIKQYISGIKECSKTIKEIKSQRTKTIKTEDIKDLGAKLDQTVHEGNIFAKRGKEAIKLMQNETERLCDEKISDSTDIAMRENMQSSLQKQLLGAYEEYNKTQSDVQQNMKDQFFRLMRAVDDTTEREELEDQMRDGDVDLGKALKEKMMGQVNEEVREAYDRAVSTLEDVIKLEKEMHEMREMMCELAFLVEQQNQEVDQIAINIESTKHQVDDGNEQVVKAINYQRKARKKTCCLIIMFTIFFILILGVLGISL